MKSYQNLLKPTISMSGWIEMTYRKNADLIFIEEFEMNMIHNGHDARKKPLCPTSAHS